MLCRVYSGNPNLNISFGEVIECKLTRSNSIQIKKDGEKNTLGENYQLFKSEKELKEFLILAQIRFAEILDECDYAIFLAYSSIPHHRWIPMEKGDPDWCTKVLFENSDFLMRGVKIATISETIQLSYDMFYSGEYENFIHASEKTQLSHGKTFTFDDLVKEMETAF